MAAKRTIIIILSLITALFIGCSKEDKQKQLEEKIQPLIIEKAELMGRYDLKKRRK